MKVIDAALAAKGLKDATASRLAVGHTSLIKNMRNARANKEEPRYSFKNLEKLAEVLDLELYFGPPRRAPSAHERMHELREMAAEFRTDTWILPLDGLDRAPPIPRLALPLSWFRAHGVSADAAALAGQHDDAMAPSIPAGATAIIDTTLTDVAAAGSGVYAIRLGSAIVLRRCDLTDQGLIARPDNPAHMVSMTPRAHLATTPVSGRVRAVISGVD